MASKTHTSNQLRALVVVPPIRDFYFTPHRMSHLGARSAHNILINNGIDAKLLILPEVSDRPRTVALLKELSYLKPHILANETGKCSFFTQLKYLGPPIEDCARMIAEQDPEVVFLSLFAFCYASEALSLAKAAKELCPDTTIVLGGAGAAVWPAYFLDNCPWLDNVIAGEAETGLAHFAKQLLRRSGDFFTVPGLWSRKDGRAVLVKPTERRPETALNIPWSLQETDTTHPPVLSLCLSRGCDKKCAYCSTCLTHGSTFRSATRDAVRTMVNSISINENGKKHSLTVNFEDDNLLLDPDLLFFAMEEIRARIPVEGFLMENGIDFNLLNAGLVNRLADAGMRCFNLSLGSTSSMILAGQDRTLALGKYDAILAAISKRNLPSITYFICGLSGETRDSIAATIAFLANRPTMLGISMFYAVPGIRDFPPESLKDASPVQMLGVAAYPWTGSVSTKTLLTAFRLSRYVNMTKADRHGESEKELIAATETNRRLHTITRTKSGMHMTLVPNQDEELVEAFFAARGPGSMKS